MNKSQKNILNQVKWCTIDKFIINNPLVPPLFINGFGIILTIHLIQSTHWQSLLFIPLYLIITFYLVDRENIIEERINRLQYNRK